MAIYRDLDRLTPEFRAKVTKWLKAVEDYWIKMFVTESWRSKKRQAELRKKGLSKTKVSNHELWLAVDIAFDKQTYWTLYPENMRLWRISWNWRSSLEMR